MCDVVNVITKSGIKNSGTPHQEKVWIGITEQESTIKSNDLLAVYKILPLLRDSRRILYNLCERKTYECWYDLEANDAAAGGQLPAGQPAHGQTEFPV